MPPIIYLILCFLFLLCFMAVASVIFFLSWEMPSLKVIYNTLGRDLRSAYRLMSVKKFLHKCHAEDKSVGQLFQELCRTRPNDIIFIYEDTKWTYQEVEDYSNQVANYFIQAGYSKGEEVALFMENCAEYICIWLGLAKVGIVPALINTNLRLHALAHSVNVVDSKAIIFNAGLASAVRDVLPLLERKKPVECYCLGKIDPNSNSFPVKYFDAILPEVSRRPPDSTKHKIGFRGKLLYIYTSGTTGLPKAAIIRHSRYLWVAAGARFMMCLQDEIYYNPLPLYHTAGGLLFLSNVLAFGGTMVIRKKFSASNFWTDAIKHRATVSQYIGEICRYLLNQPRRPEDTAHSIRMMCGNGLRPQLWREFQSRFKIKEIIEIYGATEGNANVVNLFGKVGAVGFISRIFSRLHPVNVIKVDPLTGEPIRGKDGLCIRCKPGEAGEIVGKILKNNPVLEFDGYANEAATKKKVITNCFQQGDMAFLSGDILVMDEEGYLYFMDRTGDTYRWKGENVSTSEVEGIISKVLGLAACVVYGVNIPGTEGKAGMVAIQSDTAVDMASLYDGISTSLPSYAVPLFLRICKTIESTGTYKLRKVELQKEGFDIEKVEDPVYFLDTKRRCYVKMDKDLYEQINSGQMRL